ncbi:PF07600 family protein [Leptospira kirschneri str. 200801925]|nr:PF07600 family protein [Leptospira kirschneri str. 200801925]
MGMGALLLNSDHEISSTLQKNPSETVTLLIPEDTWLLFSEKDVKLLTKKIPALLKIYGKYISSYGTFVGTKRRTVTLYQSSPGKSKTKRISVRVPSASWTLLGTLAQAHGVSRCYLFNYLLKLEALGVGDSILNTVRAGVPTFHWSYSYILHLDLLNNRVTRKLHCEPESYFYALDLEH